EGRTAQAIERLKDAISIEPEAAVLHNHAGALYLRLGDAGEAMAALERALQLDPKDPGVHFNLGNGLRLAGGLSRTVDEYAQAIDLGRKNGLPERAELHFSLGAALRATGDLAHAKMALETALKVRPEFAEAHHELAVLLVEFDLTLALEHALRAVQ